MLTLALRSFSHHRAAALATGLVAFVGMTLVTAMAALLGTGLAASTAAADRPFLTQFPLIMGGWVMAIVLFAMVSTVGVTLAGRRAEFAGLQLVGATPRQLQTLVAVETFAVTVVAALPGVACGYLTGWYVMDQVRAAGLTDAASVFAPGAVLPVAGAVVVLVASVAAARLGSRRLAGESPVGAPIAAAARTGRGTGRRIAAAVTLLAGLGSASAVAGLDPDNVATTAMTGPACVLVAVGLSVLAPELVALTTRVLRRVTRSGGSAVMHLVTVNMTVAPGRVRPVVTFLTLFVGVAAGTLSMQGIENTYASPGSTGEVLASINYLVVVLIAGFMGIALTNNLVAAIHQRHEEFAVMSLVGSTRVQTRRMLVSEVATATVASVVAGGVGAVVCVVPFAVVKTGSPWPAFAPVPYLLTTAAGAAIALGVATLVGTRTIRTAEC